MDTENLSELSLDDLLGTVSLFNDEKSIEFQFIYGNETLDNYQTNFDILFIKHLDGHAITDVQLQQLPEDQRNTLFQIQSKPKNKKKRPDECQKLFYKRAFKYSESKFFKRCKNKSRKMSQFYHYHFDAVAQSMNIPITTFYHPNKKTKPGLAVLYKTFNTKYVHHLMLSDSFKNDIKEYHKIFIQQCERERKKKVLSFSSSLEEIKKKIGKDPSLLIKHLQSSKCKIPWTDEEIQQTWELAQRDLYDRLQPDEVRKEYSKSWVTLGQNITPSNDL